MTDNKPCQTESRFVLRCVLQVLVQGNGLYYGWMGGLCCLLALGVSYSIPQMSEGLVVANMREQVSWGLYIANFSFLVGVAAAAVLLVIPAYLYNFKAIKKIVAFGDLMAITAVVMAMLFVQVDTGRPERFWHSLPIVGTPNVPDSILGWDIIALIGYLLINLIVVTHMISSTYLGREPNRRFVMPLILLSIPWAVMLHSVTAFIFNGLAARPFWNASILAPRFLASAFCAGPALMILIFQVLRRVTVFEIRDTAIFKLADIISYAMAINIFLLIAEVYKEYYTDTLEFMPMIYLYMGLDDHQALVPWIWTAMFCNLIGFFLLLIPKTRKIFLTLNIGCVLIFIGIWIEKGLGLIVPGFIPDSLGEIYEYMPSRNEVFVAVGIWAFGAILYTLMARLVIAVDTGQLRHRSAPPLVDDDEEGIVARDIMSRNVRSVLPKTPIGEVRTVLVANRISGLPVVDGNNRVIGVISETDIVFSLIHQEPQLAEILTSILLPRSQDREEKTGNTAEEVMTSPPIIAEENTPLTELTQIIAEKRISRVIIVDPERHPVGVVAQIDIVKSQGLGR